MFATTQDRMYTGYVSTLFFTQALITWVLGHTFIHALLKAPDPHACRRLEASSVILLYEPRNSVDSHSWAYRVRYFSHSIAMSCLIKYL